MNYELILAKFHGPATEFDEQETLRRLANEVAGCLEGDSERIKIETQEVLVRLRQGVARIFPDGAIFSIHELDSQTIQSIFAIAVAGDMVLLTETPKHPVIIFNQQQRKTLPYTDWRRTEASPVCKSLEELTSMLGDMLDRPMHLDEPVNTIKTESRRRSNKGTTQRRWDPRLEDLVEISIPSIVFRLHKFGHGKGQQPTGDESMQTLTKICENYVSADEEYSISGKKIAVVKEEGDWPPVLATFADYSVDVWPNHAIFTCHKVTKSLADLMLELANEGDMSLQMIDEVVFFNNQQMLRLPSGWHNQKRLTLCRSVDRLVEILAKLHKHQPNKVTESIAMPPGTWVERPYTYYIELLSEETIESFREDFGAYLFEIREKPKNFTVRVVPWLLTVPSGEKFVATSFTGGATSEAIERYAGDSERKLGWINNFDTFEDDKKIKAPLSSCEFHAI